MYKKATQLKVRFNWKGQLSLEDLWDLPLTALDKIYAELAAEHRFLQQGGLLAKPTKESELVKLKLDIVKDVFETKQLAAEQAEKAAEQVARKQRILEILEDKKDEGLKNMSVEELEALVSNM